jgi:choline dehydrogenase-like flavoprotein
MLAAAHADATLAWADNPLVGAAFQDHLDLRAGEVTILDRQRFGDAFDNIFLGGFKYNPKVTMTADAQAAARVTNIASTFTFESSVTEHLANVKIFVRGLRNGARPPNWRSMPSHLAGIARIWWPLVRRYVRDHRIFNPADLGIGLRVHCEQLPLPESRIRLDPAQRDRYGVPLAVLDWRVDGRELDAIATFTQKIASALEAAGLARVALDPRVIARDSTLLDQAQDTNHHCGGLQMGRSAADGVVDADLRVFGTTNLFVAGAATFRSSSFANPTYTALALALRLGDHLAKPGR